MEKERLESSASPASVGVLFYYTKIERYLQLIADACNMKGELLGEIRLAKESSNLEKLEEGGWGAALRDSADPISHSLHNREKETHPSARRPQGWC